MMLSIIIPTYNRPESLLRLLESLAAQRDVDWSAGEVIAVDDGSSVSYEAVLVGRDWPFRFRLLRQENGGEARARNTGAAQARGGLLLFLDDDMELLPEYVSAMCAEHEQRPDWILIGNMQTPLQPDGTTFQRVMAAQLTPTVFGEVPFTAILAGVLGVSAALYQALGGMQAVPDAERGLWTDLDFAYRAYQRQTRFYRVQRAVSLHHDAMIKDFETASRRYYRIALLAPALFARYPELKMYVSAFTDMSPFEWGKDSLRLGLRKCLRRLSSSKLVDWLLRKCIVLCERLKLPSLDFVLVCLYRWAMGAYLYRGYHDGLKLLQTTELPSDRS